SFYSIAPDMNLSKEETERVHGPGADSAWYSPYVSEIPILTDLDSVKWYFLLINPFLDYTPRLPGRYTLLMLDWAEDEQILGANVQRTGLPIAEESLTDIQKNMVEWFADRDDPAKVLGMHASIVGPRPEWDNESLELGLLRPCPFCKGSGQRRVRDRFDNRYISVGCKCKQFRGQTRRGDRWLPTEHPLLAVHTPPEEDTDTSEEGLNSMPTYGSIKLHRDWLIEKLKEKRIPLVCCGHAHRNSIFVVVNPGSYNVVGQRQVIYGLRDEVAVAFFKSGKQEDGGGYIPKGTAVRIADRGVLPIPAPELRPIFVNTIAAGPVSDDCPEKDNPIKTPPGYAEITLNSDGTVQSIEYKNSNLKLLQWECWLRKPSKAKWVKLHDGGIIARYGSNPEAMRESEKNRSTWPKGGNYECWIKRRSKAKAVKLDKKIGGIVGVYHNEGAARADKPVDEPWQKWPG
ncbi:MAG: hypothetical protein KAV87_41095, partial [Desulfobacteraceae bacterium]|nr:hypothetical protein [Desulfobacteraceae bacterium]